MEEFLYNSRKHVAFDFIHHCFTLKSLVEKG